jgi:hypothetical protein
MLRPSEFEHRVVWQVNTDVLEQRFVLIFRVKATYTVKMDAEHAADTLVSIRQHCDI